MSDIVNTVIEAGRFTTFVRAMAAADLLETFKGPGPFTVFAPTDEAFAQLSPDVVESLLRDKSRLASVLSYHVVRGRMTAQEVLTLSETRTVQGQSLKFESRDIVMVGDAHVLAVDVPAENGVIHVIDRVVLPKEQVEKGAPTPKRG